MKVEKRPVIGDTRVRRVTVETITQYDIGKERYTLEPGDVVDITEEFIASHEYHGLPIFSSHRQDPFDGEWSARKIVLVKQ